MQILLHLSSWFAAELTICPRFVNRSEPGKDYTCGYFSTFISMREVISGSDDERDIDNIVKKYL